MRRGPAILAVSGAALLAALLAWRPAALAADPAYVIGEGDVLQVTVWKNPDLTQTVTVRPDGMISLPLMNDVRASGLTADQLRKAVTDGLGGFVNSPSVSVTVSSAASYRVYTLGEVTTKGMFQLASPMTALQLLAQAGGPTPEADLAAAFILRGTEHVPLNLSGQLQGGEGVGEKLRAGDILVIPQRQASTQRVLVFGEVNSPQAIAFREGMTVLDAFLGAGGGRDSADLAMARVVRQKPGVGKVEIPVNLEECLKKGALAENIALSPGDMLVIPFRQVGLQRVLVVGEVQTPRSIPYKEGMTVLDAYVEAGGKTDYADPDSSKVIRRRPGGQKEEIRVDLERIMNKGDLDQNVPLAPGDIVVVP